MSENNKLTTTPRELRAAMKEKILRGVFGKIRGENGATGGAIEDYMILVSDQRATHILNAALRVSDFAEQGIALIEGLEKQRQPLPDMDVVYVIEPKESSVKKILEDFPVDSKVHMYRAIHLLLIGEASEQVLEPLHENKIIMRKLKNLIQMNCDFLAVEGDFFHFDMRASIVQLYSKQQTYREHCIQGIVDGMIHACIQMNEYPFVRYQAGNDLTAEIASRFQARFDAYLREDSSFWWHGDGQGNHGGQDMRGTVLFLERREDMTTPLLHEFTFQALLHDIFEMHNDILPYEEIKGMAPQDEQSKNDEKKVAVLTETDPLWIQYRHLQIKEVLDKLQAAFTEFQSTSAGKLHAKQEIDLEEMSNAVRDIPIYKQLMAAHIQHFSIAKMAMEKIQEKDLIEVASLEQTLATGVNENAKSINSSSLTTKLMQLMKSNKVGVTESLRLFCLYVIAMKGIKAADRQKIIEAIDPPLSDEDQNVIINLGQMGITVSETAATKKNKSQNRDKKAEEYAKKIAKEAKYPLSRHTPKIKGIVEELCLDQLDREEYPYVVEPPPMMSGGGMGNGQGTSLTIKLGSAASKGLSVRKHGKDSEGLSKPADMITEKFKPVEVKEEKVRVQRNTGRVIVFMAGGVTFSEVAAVDQLIEPCNKDIVIGSTQIIRPHEFIEALKYLDGSNFFDYIERIVARNNGPGGIKLPVEISPFDDENDEEDGKRGRARSFLDDVFGGWGVLCGCCSCACCGKNNNSGGGNTSATANNNNNINGQDDFGEFAALDEGDEDE